MQTYHVLVSVCGTWTLINTGIEACSIWFSFGQWFNYSNIDTQGGVDIFFFPRCSWCLVLSLNGAIYQHCDPGEYLWRWWWPVLRKWSTKLLQTPSNGTTCLGELFFFFFFPMELVGLLMKQQAWSGTLTEAKVRVCSVIYLNVSTPPICLTLVGQSNTIYSTVAL